MPQIIVVDDDASTTILVQMLLEIEGYQVSTCANTDCAVEAATRDVGAFIIDCYLKGKKSGLDLLRQIRNGATASPQDVPVIMVSGDQRLADQTRAEGADLFLLKPYSPSDLNHHLATLINHHRESETR